MHCRLPGAAGADSSDGCKRWDPWVQERSSTFPHDRLRQLSTGHQCLPAHGTGRRRRQYRQIHTRVWSVELCFVLLITVVAHKCQPLPKGWELHTDTTTAPHYIHLSKQSVFWPTLYIGNVLVWCRIWHTALLSQDAVPRTTPHYISKCSMVWLWCSVVCPAFGRGLALVDHHILQIWHELSKCAYRWQGNDCSQ